MRAYGFWNRYGIGTRMDGGERVGDLMVFDGARERDEWVDGDVFDGNWHREAVTAREAKRIMAQYVATHDIGLTLSWEGVSNIIHYVPMGELVEAYERYMREQSPIRYVDPAVLDESGW